MVGCRSWCNGMKKNKNIGTGGDMAGVHVTQTWLAHLVVVEVEDELKEGKVTRA